MEIWRDVVGYPNYQVSSWGRVKSLKYGKEKILKLSNNGKGYLFVILCKDGKQKNFYIHRLVAMAFIPNPNNLPCVNHIDENPSNNNVNNLEWCTYEYNNNYGSHNTRLSENHADFKDKNHPQARSVICITTMAVFLTVTEGAEYYNINRNHISECCKYRYNYSGKLEDGTKLVWRYLTIIPL